MIFPLQPKTSTAGFVGDPFVFNALDACNSEIDSIFDRYAELAKSEVENALNSR